MKNTQFKKALEIAIVVIFFSLFAFSLLQLVSDPDIFWHIKTGEWIWQNKKLPDKDPFSFTTGQSQDKTPVKVSFILRQYWLAQSIIYGFYRIGGFYGVIAFRCFVYLGIGLLLYRRMRKRGLNRLTILFLLVPVVWFSVFWMQERPNILSFLFSVVVIYLLEDIKESSRAEQSIRQQGIATALLRYCSLPLIMLIWSNMHAGFMIGDAIIVLYMIAEGIEIVFNKVKNAKDDEKKPNLNLLFFSVCGIALLANAYRAIPTIFRVSEAYSFYAGTTEMRSPLEVAKVGGDYVPLLLIGFMVLLLLSGIKRLKLRHILTIAFVLFISLKNIRFLPFFAYIALMFIADIWGKVIDTGANRLMSLRLCERFYIPHLCVIVFPVIIAAGIFHKTILNAPMIDPYYPEASVDFIKGVKPEGELFNHYNCGGYLIWALYPEYKVFIDGRTVSRKAAGLYAKALLGRSRSINGVPEWKIILDSYKVNMVLVPGSDVISGDCIRLVRRLVEDEDWSLVFVDTEMLLFVRNTEKNAEMIKKYSIPKVFSAYEKALEQAESYRTLHPGYWKSYAMLGEINLYFGRPKSALQYYEAALKLNPLLMTTALSRLVEELKAGQDYRKTMEELFG